MGVAGEPKYQQLASLLKDGIEQGRYSAGHRLPSEAELCAEHGVSRTTVRQALSELEALKYILRKQGGGTYIRAGFPGPNPDGVDQERFAFIYPFPSVVVNPALGEGIERALGAAKPIMRHYPCQNHLADVERNVRGAIADGASGLIVYPCDDATYSPALHRLVRDGFPLVLVDRALTCMPCDCDGSERGGRLVGG